MLGRLTEIVTSCTKRKLLTVGVNAKIQISNFCPRVASRDDKERRGWRQRGTAKDDESILARIGYQVSHMSQPRENNEAILRDGRGGTTS